MSTGYKVFKEMQKIIPELEFYDKRVTKVTLVLAKDARITLEYMITDVNEITNVTKTFKLEEIE